MLKIFIFSVLCFFALYGIMQIILSQTQQCSFKTIQSIEAPYAVLTVKNQEDCIESVVRSIAWQMLSQNSDIHYINDLIIIDLCSEDETYSILKKLAHEYDFVHPMHKDSYMELVGKL